MAVLILNSRWFPRFPGWWLIVHSIGYLVLWYVGIFMPQHYYTAWNCAFPFELGEVAFVLWMLIMRAEERAVPIAGRRIETRARQKRGQVHLQAFDFWFGGR